MKKMLLFAAIAAVAAAGCTREIEEPEVLVPVDGITVKAVAQDTTTPGTKGSYTSNKFSWTEGDQIGMVVDGSVAPFTASDIDGASAKFTYAGTATTWGTVAFYPYDENTTVEGGTIKINMPEEYFWQEGEAYLPLVANITEENPASISFKQVASGVQVRITNVPAGANKISLTVDGIQITGKFDLTFADAGTAAIVAGKGSDYNTVSILFDNNPEDRDMTFIFPLPTIADVALPFTFTLYADDTELWSRSTTKIPELTRGMVAVMADVTLAPQLEKVWSWESTSEALWTSNVTAIAITHPDNYGMARGLAMDDEYIYLPKSSAYAAICGVSITNPETQVKGNVSGISGGSTFVTSFVRMMKNTDESVNGGKDVLLLCNLTSTNSDANKLVVYAYTKGIEAAPVTLCAFCWDSANNVNDWRRYGDRFYVTGTWQSGKLYFPAFEGNKAVILSVANGARTAVTQISAGESSPSGIKDVTLYPGGDKLFLTNLSVANLVEPTGNLANGWNQYALSASSTKGLGTFGYNFFNFAGKDYIAYARLTETDATLEVIEDQGSENTFVASVDAQAGLLSDSIHGTIGTGNLGDCCVRTINGTTYIAAMSRDGGLALYKMAYK